MSAVHHATPAVRVLDRPVERDAFSVHGLRYAVPAPLLPGARARRVTVVVDLDDVEAVLVRDPRSGALHRARCVTPRASRLDALMAFCGPHATRPEGSADEARAPAPAA